MFLEIIMSFTSVTPASPFQLMEITIFWIFNTVKSTCKSMEMPIASRIITIILILDSMVTVMKLASINIPPSIVNTRMAVITVFPIEIIKGHSHHHRQIKIKKEIEIEAIRDIIGKEIELTISLTTKEEVVDSKDKKSIINHTIWRMAFHSMVSWSTFSKFRLI
jgi:hypothetical protein